MDSWILIFIFWIIIMYFLAQTIPDLVIRSPFRLAREYLGHIPIVF